MKPRDGTTNCHRYCTAFVLDTKKPLTLAITPVVSDEDAADAVGRVLDRVEQLPFEVDAILADRGYYQERVIRRARATAPVVLPVIKRKTASPSTRHTRLLLDRICDVQGQRPRASVPARGLCLLPQRRPRRERRSRPWICGVRSDRSHAQTESKPSIANAQPSKPATEPTAKQSNHHYTRPADSVCTRRCGLSVAESLAGRALDGRRPPTTGRARPSNRIHVRTGVWLDQRPSEHRAWMAVRGRLTELVYRRATPWPRPDRSQAAGRFFRATALD